MPKPKQPLDDFIPQVALIDERGPTTEWGRRKSYTLSDTGTYASVSPIARAVARRTLTHRQGRAAEKLYRHWYVAGLAGSTGSADPLKIFGTGLDASRLCATEAATTHYIQFKKALEEVERRADDNGARRDHARKVLIGVVCEERNIGDVGESIGFRGTAAETMARTILRSALNVLIKRWSL
jgi:hypothetical protein